MNYLQVLFDLLNIPFNDEYAAIGKTIEASPKKHLQLFHRYGYIFSAFQHYILWKLSLEGFMKIGDVTSTVPLQLSLSDGRLFLQWLLYAVKKNNLSSYTDTIYVFDKALLSSFDNKNTSSVLEKVGSSVYFC